MLLSSAGKMLTNLLTQKCCPEREGLFVFVFSSSYLRDSSFNVLHSRSHYGPTLPLEGDPCAGIKAPQGTHLF